MRFVIYREYSSILKRPRYYAYRGDGKAGLICSEDTLEECRAFALDATVELPDMLVLEVADDGTEVRHDAP